MNADKTLEDPAGRRVNNQFTALVRKGLLLFSQSGTQAVLQGSVDQQAQGHDHEQRHDSLGGLQIKLAGLELRVFQKPETAFRPLLSFIRLQHLEVAQPVALEFVGGQDKTAVLPELLEPVVAGDSWGTAEAIAHEGRLGTQGGSAPAAMAIERLHRRVFNLDYLQTLAVGLQRLLGVSGAGKALLTESVKRRGFPLAVFTYLPGHGLGRPPQGVDGGQQQPALRYPSVVDHRGTTQ